ncbi:response regulator transcription factor [Spirosoma agri]|uniref:Response regulator transcription factor n=1 Tax=Spirosoma agri TaxID=1987381 RepID=A0A6M0IQD3_9BACT|nr:response regulator [Spirosoma agri]NEU70127.1 response regulator transcription factor [Spirosoma agri]
MLPKLLLIEDEDNLRENIAELLSINGYHVMSALDGQQGLAQAALEPPDLIICDILMPNQNGYEVLEIVRSTPALTNTPFIFLTAKSDRLDLRHGMNLGADDYLTKPVASVDLIKAIESRLRYKKQWIPPEKPSTSYLTTLKVYNDRGSMTLRAEECLYFFTKERRYYVIHPQRTYQLNKSLEDLTAQLDPQQFFRVNRKEIIHRKTIQHFAYWQDGKYCLFLQLGNQTREVILSKARYRVFINWLQS